MDWMRGTLNILKLDLKILISLLFLLLIVSCSTVDVTSYSEEFIEEPIKTYNEFDLEIISVSELDDIRYSDEYSNISYTPYSEELYMPVPDFSPLERPDYISGYTSYSVDEFRLTPLIFVKLLKPQSNDEVALNNKNKVVLADKSKEVALNNKNKEVLGDKTKEGVKNNQKQKDPVKSDIQKVFTIKTIEESKSNKKQGVIVKTETSNTSSNNDNQKIATEKKSVNNTLPNSKVVVTKKTEVVEPKTVKKTQTSPVKKVTAVKKIIEPTPVKYIELGDLEVVVNKSFTVEMDQSGWLFEKSLDDIRFKNKFYTNSSVLFEFIADSIGDYTLEFSKYRGEEVLYSKILISVVETQNIREVFKTTNDGVLITPDEVTEYLTEKELLEKDLQNIKSHKNPDEVYFKLAEIYYDEGLLRKAKEFYEYIYDNYPFSIYYTQAEERMSYIVNNFLKVR